MSKPSKMYLYQNVKLFFPPCKSKYKSDNLSWHSSLALKQAKSNFQTINWVSDTKCCFNLHNWHSQSTPVLVSLYIKAHSEPNQCKSVKLLIFCSVKHFQTITFSLLQDSTLLPTFFMQAVPCMGNLWTPSLRAPEQRSFRKYTAFWFQEIKQNYGLK